MRKAFRLLIRFILILVITGIGLGLWNEYDLESTYAPTDDPTMPVLRTPDNRFAQLTDFPFEPRYIEIADPDLGKLRVHYIDEGPRDGEVVVLLHGQATWSYSYRKFIPLLTTAGYRVIVPDLVGFGRSDKPADWEDHTFEKHVDWLEKTLLALNIKNATGFLFDWGGFFGMRVMLRQPDMFSRVILCTTTMPQGKGIVNALWVAWWRRHILKPPVFPISGMVAGMTDNEIDAQTTLGLDAPYPDESYKSGPRRFPMMIPATFLNPSSKPNQQAWKALKNWPKPTLTLVSERLAARGFNPNKLHKQIPGTKDQAHQTYPDTGFFLIEDAAEQLAQKTIEFIQANPN